MCFFYQLRVTLLYLYIDGINTVGLYTYDAMEVWFDEIYVGFDHTLNFHCPYYDAHNNVFAPTSRSRPLWRDSITGPPTETSPKVSSLYIDYIY